MLDGDAVQAKRQIGTLQRQIHDNDREDQKLYQAYMADVFDEHEFAVRRRRLKEARASLEQELEQLRAAVLNLKLVITWPEEGWSIRGRRA